jgi:hypothetical protein
MWGVQCLCVVPSLWTYVWYTSEASAATVVSHHDTWAQAVGHAHLEEICSQAQVSLGGQPDGGAIPQQVSLHNLNSLQEGHKIMCMWQPASASC